MNFNDALNLIMNGKKMIRKSFQEKVNTFKENKGIIAIRLSDNKDCLVSESKQGYIEPWPKMIQNTQDFMLQDFLADDWIEVI